MRKHRSNTSQPCSNCHRPHSLPVCPHCQTPTPTRTCPGCGESRLVKYFHGRGNVTYDECRYCRRPRLGRDGLNGYTPVPKREFVMPPGCAVLLDFEPPDCPEGEGVAVLMNGAGPVVKPAVVYRILDVDERGRVVVRNEMSNLRDGEVCLVLR